MIEEQLAGKPEGWQTPYLSGALVVLPPEPVRGRVNRLRRRYDPQSAQMIPAHITVAQPFREQPDEKAIAEVSRILEGRLPFRVHYGPLRSFLPYPCIWYEVQPADRIIELRRALHSTGLFNTDLPYTEGFVPHMSITDGRPGPEETAKILARLQGRVKSGTFTVDELVYTRPDWQMRFRTIRHLPLGDAFASKDRRAASPKRVDKS